MKRKSQNNRSISNEFNHFNLVKHQIDMNPSNNYWIICQYSETWLPRAVFLPENHKLIPKIGLLRKFTDNNDYIITQWANNGPNCRSSDGYHANGKHCNNKDNVNIYEIIVDLDSHIDGNENT